MVACRNSLVCFSCKQIGYRSISCHSNQPANSIAYFVSCSNTCAYFLASCAFFSASFYTSNAYSAYCSNACDYFSASCVFFSTSSSTPIADSLSYHNGATSFPCSTSASKYLTGDEILCYSDIISFLQNSISRFGLDGCSSYGSSVHPISYLSLLSFQELDLVGKRAPRSSVSGYSS